jgi:hypothetical protein
MVMNVKLKDNVFGFTWNYETGEVEEVFTEELTPKEIQLMGRVMGEDICLILEEQDIELVFGEDIETRDDLEEMGLTEVMELV